METEKQNLFGAELQSETGPEKKADEDILKAPGPKSDLVEALELWSRHKAITETMSVFKEFMPLAAAWVKQQPDYETNLFKQSMVASFYKVINEKLKETLAEFEAIEPRIFALAAKVEKCTKVEEINHGNAI